MIDPVTLSLILKGVGKAAPAIGQFLGARAGAEAMKQDPSQIAQQYEELKKSMPQYGVGSGWNEYLAMAKQDPAADMQRQIAAEQEASAVGALKAGGAKALLGGLGASQRQAAQSRMGIEAGAQQRQQAALQQYAGQQQRVQDINTRMAQELAQSQFQAERGAEQYNRQLEAQKKQALGAGLGYLAGGLASELPDEINLKGLFGGGQADQKQTPGTVQPVNVMSNEMLNVGTEVTGLPTTDYYNMNPFGSPQPFPWDQRNGGMITPGAFSHKKNPIHMIDGDGDKVGEVTGGEVILNPEHKKKVAQQSPFFRKLLREFAMRRRND